MKRIITFSTIRVSCVLSLLALFGCWPTEPRMEILTENRLAEAERLWKAHGSDSYHLVVQVEATFMTTMVYDVTVRGGEVVGIKKDGQPIQPEHTEDYSISGLFRLMRLEMGLTQKNADGTYEALAEVFAYFDPETGRVHKFRRTTSRSGKTRTLRINVLNYEPETANLKAHSG